MRAHGFLHHHAVPRPECGLPRRGRAVVPYTAMLLAAPAFVAGHAPTHRDGAAVASADGPPVHSARVPLNAVSVRAERDEIERLAAVLAATDVPVSARGVARASVLVTNATSPPYSRCGEELHRRLIQTLFEIERGASA